MLRPEEIRDRLKNQPFVPLRIIASENQRYDIYHPDSVMVLDRSIIIGLPQIENTIYERSVRIAIVHIVGLEDLVPLAKANEHEA